jgi:hypothetical protein
MASWCHKTMMRFPRCAWRVTASDPNIGQIETPQRHGIHFSDAFSKAHYVTRSGDRRVPHINSTMTSVAFWASFQTNRRFNPDR